LIKKVIFLYIIKIKEIEEIMSKIKVFGANVTNKNHKFNVYTNNTDRDVIVTLGNISSSYYHNATCIFPVQYLISKLPEIPSLNKEYTRDEIIFGYIIDRQSNNTFSINRNFVLHPNESFYIYVIANEGTSYVTYTILEYTISDPPPTYNNQ